MNRDPLEGRRIGINAMPLLEPLAGIGQYTLNLVRGLQQALPERPSLFYGAGWDPEIRSQRLRVAADDFKQFVARWVPKPYVLSRFLQQRHFDAGVRSLGIALYHEPNYLAFRFDGPTVVTVHDLSWIRFPETHPPERVRMMNDTLPSVVARATQIIVDSDFIRDEVIAQYALPKERVTTVRLGVEDSFRPLDANACASILDSHGLRFGEYVLAVGTLEPRKNLATVLAAYAKLPAALRQRHPLVVAGRKGWGETELADSLRRHGIERDVKIVGYVPQDDLPKLYAGARLFVYPSIYEGFGLPPLEAMACRVPTIVSRRASLPELVGEAALLIEALDEGAWTEAMRSLLEDEGRSASLAAAGLERARGFTWRECALQTMEVYRKALG